MVLVILSREFILGDKPGSDKIATTCSPLKTYVGESLLSRQYGRSIERPWTLAVLAKRMPFGQAKDANPKANRKAILMKSVPQEHELIKNLRKLLQSHRRAFGQERVYLRMIGLVLGEGLGLSSQVGDMSSFFLTLGICMLVALVSGRRAWYYPPILLLLLAAVGRVVAWLLYDAALAPQIGLEILVAAILLVAARRLAREAYGHARGTVVLRTEPAVERLAAIGKRFHRHAPQLLFLLRQRHPCTGALRCPRGRPAPARPDPRKRRRSCRRWTATGRGGGRTAHR